MNYIVFYIIIILYRIICYLYFMQMSFLQFQITVNLYKLISFNSRFARLSWVSVVNILVHTVILLLLAYSRK